MTFEVIYEFFLIFGLGLVTVFYITFPRKIKYNQNGQVKKPDGLDVKECFIWFYIGFMTLITCIRITTKGTVVNNYCWPLLILSYFLSFCSISLIWGIEARYTKRKMLLLTTDKYQDLTREELEEFCKKYSLSIFPLALLDQHLKDFPDIQPKEMLLKMGSTFEYITKTKEIFDRLSLYGKNVEYMTQELKKKNQ